jgi:redox-sensitive bicupin YhaK (pirin superfamily)
MIERRPFAQLGGANHGWLDAKHHFSFAGYHDAARMGWGALRVWNDDTIAAGTGFPPHAHADMEIITYVREGAITHQDNLGNKGRTEAGDVQVMSAGSGVRHSEYNHESVTTKIFQIWIIPDGRGQPPSWGAKPFPKGDRSGQFVALASGMPGDEDALPIRANARVLGATLKAGESAEYRLGKGRCGYLVTASGEVEIEGVHLDARDGAAIRDVRRSASPPSPMPNWCLLTLHRSALPGAWAPAERMPHTCSENERPRSCPHYHGASPLTTAARESSLAGVHRCVSSGIHGLGRVLPCPRLAGRRRITLGRTPPRGLPLRHFPVVLRWPAHSVVVAQPAHGAPGRAVSRAPVAAPDAAEVSRQSALRDSDRSRFRRRHSGLCPGAARRAARHLDRSRHG